jgi:hypothetical protein
MRDVIVDNVIDKYYERSQIGITKYGTTLANNNTDEFLKHLQEELMDATLYIEKLISLREEMKLLANMYSNDAELGKNVRNLVT